MRRGVIAPIAVLAALAVAQPAAARAPLAQLREVRAGTAIVQYDRKLTTSKRVARLANTAGATKAVRYRKLPLVTVRGGAATLTRIAKARGIKAIHMDRKLTYFLHESVPVAYGGQDPRSTFWTQGYDGSG